MSSPPVQTFTDALEGLGPELLELAQVGLGVGVVVLSVRVGWRVLTRMVAGADGGADPVWLYTGEEREPYDWELHGEGGYDRDGESEEDYYARAAREDAEFDAARRRFEDGY